MLLSAYSSLETRKFVYADWNVNGKLSIMSRKAAMGLFDISEVSFKLDMMKKIY